MNRLKERRLELGLTQEAVSGILKLADPRMDVSMVSRFENGVCLPTEEVTEALEAALWASRAYLFGGDGAGRRSDPQGTQERHQPGRPGGGAAHHGPEDAKGRGRGKEAGPDDLQRRGRVLPERRAERPVAAIQAGDGAG